MSIENKFFLQGVWKEYQDCSQKQKQRLVIHGSDIDEIVDKIVNSTTANGIIVIFQVQIPEFQMKALRVIRVCSELECTSTC